jgi:hypothetical protein
MLGRLGRPVEGLHFILLALVVGDHFLWVVVGCVITIN